MRENRVEMVFSLVDSVSVAFTFWSSRKFFNVSTVLKLISRDTARKSKIFVGIWARCSSSDDDKSLFSCQITLPVSASRKIIQFLHTHKHNETNKKSSNNTKKLYLGRTHAMPVESEKTYIWKPSRILWAGFSSPSLMSSRFVVAKIKNIF